MASCDDVMATRRHPLGVGRRTLGISNHSLGIRRRPLGVRLQALGVTPRTLGFSNLPLGKIEKTITYRGLRPDRKPWFRMNFEHRVGGRTPVRISRRPGCGNPQTCRFRSDASKAEETAGSGTGAAGDGTMPQWCGIRADRRRPGSFRHPGIYGGRQDQAFPDGLRSEDRRNGAMYEADGRWCSCASELPKPPPDRGSFGFRRSAARTRSKIEERRLSPEPQIAVGPLSGARETGRAGQPPPPRGRSDIPNGRNGTPNGSMQSVGRLRSAREGTDSLLTSVRNSAPLC